MQTKNKSLDLRSSNSQNSQRLQGLQTNNQQISLQPQMLQRSQVPYQPGTGQNSYASPKFSQYQSQQIVQQPNYESNRQLIMQQRQSPQVGNQQKTIQNEPQNKKSHKNMDEEYEPLKIPADWELARKHALARSVGQPIHSDEQETCPCCGYQVHREDLDVIGSTNQLAFLGSGFPLFYNFIMYCILILVAYFFTKGAYNLYTNLESDFCKYFIVEQFIVTKIKTIRVRNVLTRGCIVQVWRIKLSFKTLISKTSRPDQINFSENLNLLVLIIVTFILFLFRKSQRLIDKQIDDDNITPADYTLMVKNIPRGLDLDYKQELNKIFTYNAIPDSASKIVVTKVTLVYDIEELIEKEEGLKKIVEEKQEELQQNGMKLNHPKIEKIDKQIERADKEIEKLKEYIQRDGSKFSGIAFVSFLTEKMKADVLENNSHTTGERWHAYTNDGKSKNLSHQDLSWLDQKLFLEEAPEPNDIDWEFVHVSTTQKLLFRIKSWGIVIAFMLLCFFIIYALSHESEKLDEWAEKHEKTVDQWTLTKINILSGSISWVIVLFNKFIMGYTYHHIVDSERISSKTKFNIQFAFKLTIALFINTAVLSYIVDILLLGNIITKGGFVQNETQIFIVNALFPPFVWFIDPYNLLKEYQRNKELEKGKMSVVTQQEANYLMEKTEYYQAKRYADIMKTMWFTFLYGSCIPIGILISIVGLIFYYWVDKYNVMRRRTVKENLAKEVSTEMISLLEYTVVFCGIGNMTMSYSFFGYIHWQDIVVFFVGFLFAVLPMQELNDYIFQFEDEENTKPYDQVQKLFVTDYDRENPVTRIEAIKSFRENHNQY